MPGSTSIAVVLAGYGLLGAACATSDPIGVPGEGGASGEGGSAESPSGPGSGGSGGGGAASSSTASSTSSTSTTSTGTTSTADATSSASGGGCGDGQIDGAEACDGADLGGATCQTEGFDTGTIACDASCALDVTGCTDVLACDNGVDDDGDGLLDAADPACTGAGDDDELVVSPSCDGFGGAVIDLTTAPGTPIVQIGTTVGAPAALTSTTTASCPATGGPEVAFRLVLGQATDLLLSLDHPGTSAGWDPVLYVRSASCIGTQVGCNDDAGGSLRSELVLSAVPAGTYFVFVDSAGSSGDFELHVTPL
jgi:hypothetical protein